MRIAAGGFHTCAILTSGKVRCWGIGDNGVLGHGNTTTIGDDENPASAGDVNVGVTVVDLSLDADHTCALGNDGSVREVRVGKVIHSSVRPLPSPEWGDP